MDNKDCLIRNFNNNGFDISNNQCDLFIKLYNTLIEANNVMNLTTITDWKDVVIKHYIDSCYASKYMPTNSHVLDIGAGAGFPSIPLKIIRPDLDIVMLDSLQKRVNFLNKAISELLLTNIQAIHSRAEEYINVSRETFDVVVARAVANMNTLVEYCLPYVKIGGLFIAYKSNVDEELSNAEKAIEILGGKVESVEHYKLEDNERCLVLIRKIKNTPNKYPRGQNKPRTSPIK